jgi:hypothetical protein
MDTVPAACAAHLCRSGKALDYCQSSVLTSLASVAVKTLHEDTHDSRARMKDQVGKERRVRRKVMCPHIGKIVSGMATATSNMER